MPVEPSCFLSDKDIVEFLFDNYGIRPAKIEKIETGSANCFKLDVDGNRLFLKEIQSKYTQADAQKEIEACRILSEFIPTSSFVKTLNNRFMCLKDGHVIHLQIYIAGSVIGPNKYDDNQMRQAAQTLAKIHKHLEGKIILDDGFPDGWFTGWRKDDSIEKYTKILSVIGNKEPLAAVKKDICYKKIRLLKECSINPETLTRFTKVNSHGDYNYLQLLFDEQKQIVGVIDFTSVSRLPAVWEIIRSYTYCARECINGSCIDTEKLKNYITDYLDEGSLSLYDVKHMAEFYYLNLLRSSYGIDSNDEKLLAFAKWRTDMCEYLSGCYKNIGDYLANEFKGILK